MKTKSSYKEHEVGAGRVSPRRLGRRLASMFPGRRHRITGIQCWLGAAGLALCFLSWWDRAPVPDVIHGLIRTVTSLVE